MRYPMATTIKLLALIAVGAYANGAAARCDVGTVSFTGVSVELPSDLSTIEEKYRPFIGVWGCGKWDNGRDAALAITKIDKNGNASGRYFWGRYRQSESGSQHFSGKIVGQFLSFSFSSGAKLSFELKGNVLTGVWEHSQYGTYSIAMKRM